MKRLVFVLMGLLLVGNVGVAQELTDFEESFFNMIEDSSDKSDEYCEARCNSQWNTCLDGCRNLPSDRINSCYVGCNLGYDYCRARCD